MSLRLVSAKQLKEWYAEFIQECPNGQMDKQTFMQNFGEHFFPADGNTIKLAEYVFKRFDANQVNYISIIKSFMFPKYKLSSRSV